MIILAVKAAWLWVDLKTNHLGISFCSYQIMLFVYTIKGAFEKTSRVVATTQKSLKIEE